MRPMPVQYITREMIARVKGPQSLLRMTLTDGEWERRAARLLVSWFVLLVSCVGALLFLGGVR